MITFLAPGFAWGLLSLPLITVLYLLRRRYLPRQVPSTFLWEKALRDSAANRPFQKLRKNLLLPLQLLAAACLVLALMQPVTGGGKAGKTVLILDLSASMQTRSGGRSRLEEAREAAAERISRMPAGEEITILGAGEEVRQVLLSSRDRDEALRALNGLEAGRGGMAADKAVSLARAICREGDTGGDILVFSDSWTPPEGVSLIAVGQGEANRAVASLTAEEGRAWVRVANYGGECTVTLICRADGVLCEGREMTIPEGETAGAGFTIPEGTSRVQVSIREEDALTADNSLEAPVVRKRTLTVATAADSVFLESALKARGGVTVIRVSEEELAGTAADCYIRGGGSLLFSLTPEAGVLRAGEARPAETGTLTLTGDNPLTGGLSLRNVSLRSFSPVEGGETALRADGEPVLCYAPGEVCLGIDLHETNLALKYDFPILVQNILNWLMPGETEEADGEAQAPIPPEESDVRRVAADRISEGNRTESARGTEWRTALLCAFLALILLEFLASRAPKRERR